MDVMNDKQSILHYGRSVNSHDLMKVLATVLMIIDHVGYYLFDDVGCWRLLGRGAAPLFFYQVGRAPHHGFSWLLLVYGIGITLLNFGLFNLIYINILINFAIIKYFLSEIEVKRFTSQDCLLWLCFFTLMNLLLEPYLEYGAQGLMIALAARLLAQNNWRGKPVLIIALSQFFIVQIFSFNFIQSIDMLLAVGLLALSIGILMWGYRFKEWQQLDWIKWPLLIVSRYSVHIYCWHLVLLKCIAAYRIRY